MKKRKFRSVIDSLFIIAFFGLLVASCNNEDPINEDSSATLESSAFSQAEIDNVSEGVNDIIENVFFDVENPTSSKNEVSKNSSELKFIPDCVTITSVMTGNKKSVVIDYGEGCTMHNGNILSGKINMEITFVIGELKAIIDSSFDNFYFDGNKVEGVVKNTRTIANGVPEAVINSDIKIIWEDASFVTVVGKRKRVWIEGFKNFHFGDNVFLVTGNWTITKKDGVVRTITILESLRREMSCRYIVSGIVKIEQDGNGLTVNYGDGECDDLATVLIGDKQFEFHIGRRHGI